MGSFKGDEKFDRTAVMDHLQQAFPNLSVKKMGGVSSIGEGPMVGTWVTVSGKKITTMPMAHGFWFLLLILLAGSVIGIVLYGVLYVPKQKELMAKVDDVLKSYPGVK